jgi:hypothetical protein
MNNESECEDIEIRSIRQREHWSYDSYVFGEEGVF